ncbi:MAG: bifunctional hydroxymethylpyrimidine kinase/phosphomethylpyrimidine kinase [Lachnospiraceae bacterium]|nr:bifunctional hydroxymethylpyrimidine kinase/phosphomethylpyrimidine kinase [Lachnospiraceae bacterium]
MKTALSIAGSDSSGGAGIQADIKTMTVNGVYAMTAVTALTAQNTMGVSAVLTVSPEFLAQQMDAVFTDIRPDAVKIGMVSAPELVAVIAEKLVEYRAENVVVDPVLGATSGASLAQGGTAAALCEKLFPLATVITPNIPEAEVLSGLSISSPEDMERAARQLGDQYGCAVLLKGGHSINDADDFLYIPQSSEESGNREIFHQSSNFTGKGIWFHGRRIDNPNTHGTGCTLSSAIAANLAKGMELSQAVAGAKEYISAALAAGLNLGHGSGPLNHMVI